MGIKTGKGRMVHYDLLRILAAFSVVMLHSAAKFWYDIDVRSGRWIVANTYDALFRFGVPLFVMLSGALFLQEGYKLNLKRLYAHNILKLVAVFVFWSCIYGLWDCASMDWSLAGWMDVVREMVYGRYHLWFLPMLVGIYVLLPILRVWVHNAGEKNLRYFLALFFVLQILRETLKVLWPSKVLVYLLDMAEVELACGYVGYFVLGYYIVHVGIPRRYHKAVYFGAVPAALLNVALGNFLALRAGEPKGEIYDSFGLFTFWTVAALFLFFTDVMGRLHYSDRMSRAAGEVSMGTLGVYVMHVGMLELLPPMGVQDGWISVLVRIPLQAVFCFAVCLGIAALLRRIPLVGKYIC